MKKKLIILTALLFSSCNKVDNSNYEFIVTDLVNREVKINSKSKERVLCIGAGALRLYSYIGDVKKIVAVEDIDRNVNSNIFENVSRPYYDVNKEYFSTLPSCGKGGPQAQYAEVEKIISCNPTLIISEYNDVNKANDLQNKTQVPVLVLSYGKDSVFDEKIKTSFNLLGKVLNEENKANKLNQYISSCKNELYSNSINIPDENKPSMYIGCLGNWGRQDIFSTSSSFPLFNVSNIKYSLNDTLIQADGKIEEEKFFSLNIDKMILDAAGLEKLKVTYQNNENMFDTMDVFKNNEIYLEMPFNAYYTNLEIALMNSYYIASVSYPDVYKDYNLIDKYNEITQAFLSVDYYDEIKKAPYSYNGYQKITNFKEFIKSI